MTEEVAMPIRVYEALDAFHEHEGELTPSYRRMEILDYDQSPFSYKYFQRPEHAKYARAARLEVDPLGPYDAEAIPIAEWPEVRIKWVRVPEPGSGDQAPDLTDPNRPFASQRAKDSLEPLLRGCVDWLPLIAEAGRYYWMRPKLALDAVDYERSDIECHDYGTTFRPGMGVRYIHRLVIKEAALGSAPVFRVRAPDGYTMPCDLFVTQPFVDAYRAAGLTGLDLVERWPNPEPRRLPRPNPYPHGVPEVSTAAEELPAISAAPLPPELQVEFRRMSEDLLRKPADLLAAELKAELDKLRAAATRAETLEEAVNDMGLRFGYLLARELQWRLQWCRYEGMEGTAVVSLDSKFAVFPAHWIYAKVTNKDETNTLLLLYNMLKAGTLPPAPAKGTKLIW